ncbi:mCG148405 [Mus musculus]|nr:mCG148405 [Mus musculus]
MLSLSLSLSLSFSLSLCVCMCSYVCICVPMFTCDPLRWVLVLPLYKLGNGGSLTQLSCARRYACNSFLLKDEPNCFRVRNPLQCGHM